MSYRPLTLYDPDSDDSSSDGGSVGGRAHAAMGIANDQCRRDSDSDRFSLNSDLMEIISGDEMDDPMLRPNHYNPANFRVEMGKRVGVDSDDDSDGDGDHYGRDKDYGVPSRMRTSGDIDEHSIGSDDEYQTAHTQNFPKHITRNDAELDAMIPTGNARERTTGGAGEPDDAFAEGDTDEQHMAKKASQKARKEEEYKQAEGKGREAATKAGKRLAQPRLESKRLVAEALAKARAVKGTGLGARVEKQFLEGKAKQLARGNIAGATLSEATREKGKEILTKLGKNLATEKGKEQGKLAEKFDERQKEEMGKARAAKAKAGALAQIKSAGTTGKGKVVEGTGRQAGVKGVVSKTSSGLQSALKKVEGEAVGRGKAVKSVVERLLKGKAFASLVSAVREGKEDKQKKSAVAKIVKAMRASVAKTKAEATLVARLIAEKFASERESVGGEPSAPPRVAGNEDRTTVTGDPRAGTTVTGDPSGGTVAGDPSGGTVAGGRKLNTTGRVTLDEGHVVEIKPYGSQIRIYLDDEELKAGKSSTEADAGVVEGLIAQIKAKYGTTAFPEIRKKLGDRAVAIRKQLRKAGAK